jgi:cell division GTPase FtsZ
MNRNELIFCGLGGGGSRLVDTIMLTDPRFAGYFINTSMTDIESLENYNEDTKNFFCISTNNGVGRNRKLGKSFAKQSGYSILDIIERFNQDSIYFTASLGGGSGSALLSELLQAIEKIKDDPENDFKKTINVVAILPDLNSPTVILKNARDTWNEIIKYKCINSIIFVNNNCKLEEDFESSNDKEVRINEIFAETFSSIFDIPLINGINFDNGNLSNLLNDKGCLYFYNLPDDCTSVEIAMSKAERNSILGKMYKNEENTVLQKDANGKENKLIKCGYLGISFVNEDYNKNFITTKYRPYKEPYVGENADKNLERWSYS